MQLVFHHLWRYGQGGQGTRNFSKPGESMAKNRTCYGYVDKISNGWKKNDGNGTVFLNKSMEIGNQICSIMFIYQVRKLCSSLASNWGSCWECEKTRDPKGPRAQPACTLQVFLAQNSSMESQNVHVHFWETCGNFGVLPWFRGVYTAYIGYTR